MKFTCLNKGSGFHFPPCHILNVSGIRILVDCPLDLSAQTIFSPIPMDEDNCSCSVHDLLDTRPEIRKEKNEKLLDAKSLIHAEPWYKTTNNLQLWDPSSIDVVLISSFMGMLGLPFLTQSKSFSAKIYATEATTRLGKLMMEDLVSMHMEFQQYYGVAESTAPQWMSWEELELLPSALRDVAFGKDGAELGGWLPLYSAADVQDCMKKVHTLKYAEAACYNGTLVVKAFSSGLEIGSCNWAIDDPKRSIAYISNSIFLSASAMEFDYHALRGNDVVLFSDFSSREDIEDAESEKYCSSPTISSLVTLSSDEDNGKDFGKFLLNNDETQQEKERLAFISSCVVDSVKAGGSALIPINHLGIVLQLFEQLSVSLESSAVKVPIYFISSVAKELLTYTNTIPEWLCMERQQKLFSGEPLFSHTELMDQKKLCVFPAIHSPELLTNWQEPCIIFSPHCCLRLGPAVHLLRRWCRDPNALLILEDELDAELALLPFKPIAMKVLQCSFHSGIRLSKAQPLLKILQPKVVLFPEVLRQRMNFSNSSLDSFPVVFYNENETINVPSLKEGTDVNIASGLATRFSWRKLKQANMEISRLEGRLCMVHGKHWLLAGNNAEDSSQSGAFLQWGSLDLEKLLSVLSNMGITGSIEQNMSDGESESGGIIHVHDPIKALIEVQATSTVISAADGKFAALLSEAIGTLLDCI